MLLVWFKSSIKNNMKLIALLLFLQANIVYLLLALPSMKRLTVQVDINILSLIMGQGTNTPALKTIKSFIGE